MTNYRFPSRATHLLVRVFGVNKRGEGGFQVASEVLPRDPAERGQLDQLHIPLVSQQRTVETIRHSGMSQ